MSRRIVYQHHTVLALTILSIILVLVIGLIFIGAIGIAFEEVGFSVFTTAFILIATFIGSSVNIPLMKRESTIPIIKDEVISFFGMGYRIPQVEYGEIVTIIAVNLGGALIPSCVSFYLLWKAPAIALYALAGVVVVAVVTHAVARPVKGVGIITPAFIPPITAIILAILLPSGSPK
jgi:uncharacterized membrane protein